MACLASALVSFGGGAAWQPSAAASRMDRVWRGRIAYLRWGGRGEYGRCRAVASSHRSFAPTHPSLIPLRKVCTSDRGAGGRGGGRFTREGATKAQLGGAELARAGSRPVACFGVPSRVGARSPAPQPPAPVCAGGP